MTSPLIDMLSPPVEVLKGYFQLLVSAGPLSFDQHNKDIKHTLGICATYHEVIPRIYDNNTLDSDSSALYLVILKQLSVPNILLVDQAFVLTPQQCETILYFLSPEASLRNNLTAVGMIIWIYSKLQTSFRLSYSKGLAILVFDGIIQRLKFLNRHN
jgi:hypothetical protein